MSRRTPQDRFSNRMADIERDYERQVARGMDPVVARAKRRQRVADARDDLAIRSGGDRSQTRADERAAESALTSARRGTRAMTALPSRNVATPTPRIASESAAPASVSSADIAAATSGRAPEAYRSRGEAFAAARRRGDTTFTWNGRLFHTRTAEEENARSSRGSSRPSNASTPAPTSTRAADIPRSRRTAEADAEIERALAGISPRPPARSPSPRTSSDRQQAQMDELAQSIGSLFTYSPEANRRLAERQRARGLAKGGSVKKMAKGGSVKKSIDGIAKRGKTRLSTRKK